MNRGIQGTDHVWLVMMKAMRALTRYAAAGIEETGLGLSDFGVLEVLLGLRLAFSTVNDSLGAQPDDWNVCENPELSRKSTKSPS